MIKQLFGVSSKSNVKKQDESEYSSKYKVGDLIEARYRGREKFLPGKIARDCFDGTFDIDYDDGGKEVSVRLEFIKDPRKKFNYKVYSSKTSPSVLDMSNFLLARVMVDFVPTKSFQLALSKGDIITVIYEDTPDGWSKGIDDKGNCGFFPADHISIIDLSRKVNF